MFSLSEMIFCFFSLFYLTLYSFFLLFILIGRCVISCSFARNSIRPCSILSSLVSKCVYASADRFNRYDFNKTRSRGQRCYRIVTVPPSGELLCNVRLFSVETLIPALHRTSQMYRHERNERQEDARWKNYVEREELDCDGAACAKRDGSVGEP